MRTDRTRSTEFIDAESWKYQKYKDALFTKQEQGPPFFRSNSFSGHEPNHLFLNDSNQYVNATLVSGADHEGDGRGFAILDYDKDGWLDIALMSTNAPRFKLLRNMLGESVVNERIRVVLEGSNSTAQSSINSNRDGIGAKVFVTYQSGQTRLLHRQVGEGNVAQNSGTIWIGQTPTNRVDTIKVMWPSGKSSIVKDFDSVYVCQIVEPD